MQDIFVLSKILLLFCSIFGCQSDEFLDPNIRTTLNASLCTERGRFPNPLDLKCQSYLLCLKDQDDNFVSEIVPCPLDTIFNATTGRCARDNWKYLCPHLCNNEVGKFPYRQIDCQHYVACEFDLNGKIGAELKRCPNGTWFCGDLRECVSGAVDTCKLNSSTSTVGPGLSSTQSVISTTESELSTTESELSTTESEPSTTESEPSTTESELSSTSFQSSTATESTEGLETTTLGLDETTLTEEVTSDANWSTSNNITTDFDTTTAEHPIRSSSPFIPTTEVEPEDDTSITCTKEGRFPIKGICDRYMLCMQGIDGCWIMSLVKCPKGQVFSEKRLRCVSV